METLNHSFMNEESILNSASETISLPKIENLRIHCVSVRLKASELQRLNELRGITPKGEWLRMCLTDSLPVVVPEINRNAWIKLGNISLSFEKLVSLLQSKHQDSTLSRTELFVIKKQINDLRIQLLSSNYWSSFANERNA